MKINKPYIADDQTEFGVGVEVNIHQVIDHYNGTCSVSVSLDSDQVKAVRDIGTMTYTETWEDKDILTFINKVINGT